jgi:HEAT repeat protein
MKTLKTILLASGLLAVPALASAQSYAEGEFRVHDRSVGELSHGTSAPSSTDLVAAIRTASPSALSSMLEYGERVECHACVPLLEERLLTDDNAEVRSVAAWWLARRPFGFAAVMHEIRGVLASDPDPVRRERAAEAIGNFGDPHGVAHLTTAFHTDTVTAVRVAAVCGLVAINAPNGLTVISEALGDTSSEVRAAALANVTRINFFSDYDALLPLLADDDAAIRRRAATVLGSLRVDSAVVVLAALLRNTAEDAGVRREAAWALGRIGGAEADIALAEVLATTGLDPQIRNAIEVARDL